MTEILTILQCTVIMNERIFPYGILSNVSKELNILEKNYWDISSKNISYSELEPSKPSHRNPT